MARRKYRSSKKYSYNQGAKTKKIVLIALAAVLAAALIAAALFFIFAGSDNNTQNRFTVLSRPDKTTYFVGESPSWYGFEAKLTTDTGSTVTLGPESCTFSGFNSSVPVENQVITVRYKQHTATFNIKIVAKSDNNQQNPADGQFNGMSFKTMPQTWYKVGDWLSVQGGVLLLRYDNGATKEVALNYDMVSGFTTAAPGFYTLTVTYIEDGHRATLTYDITVTE